MKALLARCSLVPPSYYEPLPLDAPLHVHSKAGRGPNMALAGGFVFC